jgi:hypothetical protein
MYHQMESECPVAGTDTSSEQIAAEIGTLSEQIVAQPECPVCEVPFSSDHVAHHEKIAGNIFQRTRKPHETKVIGERICFRCLVGLFAYSPEDADLNNPPAECHKCGCVFCRKCINETNMKSGDEEKYYDIVEKCVGCDLKAHVEYK